MRYLPLLVLSVILTSCATVSGDRITCAADVRRQSQADDVLFADLMTAVGGIAFADKVYFPTASMRKVTRITPIARSNGVGPAMEEWMIDHGAEGTVVYVVTITPDGRGGAYFSVQKK